MEPELTGELAGASFFPADLQCAPRAIARALAGRLPRVHTGVEVHAIAIERDRVTGLRTSDGALPCAAAVIAAGPWSRPLAEAAGVALPLEPRKGQLVRLAAPARDDRLIRHKVVEAGYLDSVASADAALQVTTVLETTWEGDVLVGSSRERRGFDLSVDDAVSAAMLERAFALMPGLRGLPVDAAWAGLRPWLPDHLPAIGPSKVARRAVARHRARGRRRRARPRHRAPDRPALCGRGAGRRPGAVLTRSLRALKARRAGRCAPGPSRRLLKGGSPSAPPGLRARRPQTLRPHRRRRPVPPQRAVAGVRPIPTPSWHGADPVRPQDAFDRRGVGEVRRCVHGLASLLPGHAPSLVRPPREPVAEPSA